MSCGLRMNPQLSFVNDDRYDPCRKFSQLGVPMNQLLNIDKTSFKKIEGILVHNNAESRNFEQLFETVMHIINQMPQFLKSLKWINLGGGYLLDEDVDLKPLLETIFLLNRKYKQTVF